MMWRHWSADGCTRVTIDGRCGEPASCAANRLKDGDADHCDRRRCDGRLGGLPRGDGWRVGDGAGGGPHRRRHVRRAASPGPIPTTRTPRAYHDLNVAGMKAHAALAEEFGATPWWHGGGNVEWTAPEDRAAQQAKVERLRGVGLRGRMDHAEGSCWNSSPTSIPRQIGDAPIAYYRRGGLARSGGLYRRHAGRRARRAVPTVICGARVSDTVHARWPGDRREDRGWQAVRGRHGGELCRPLGERSGVGCRPASAAGADRGVPGLHPAGRRPGWAASCTRRSSRRGRTVRGASCCTGMRRTRHLRSIRGRVPSMPEARDLVQRLRTLLPCDRRCGAGGGAHGDPADPGDSLLRRRPGATAWKATISPSRTAG